MTIDPGGASIRRQPLDPLQVTPRNRSAEGYGLPPSVRYGRELSFDDEGRRYFVISSRVVKRVHHVQQIAEVLLQYFASHANHEPDLAGHGGASDSDRGFEQFFQDLEVGSEHHRQHRAHGYRACAVTLVAGSIGAYRSRSKRLP